MKKRKQKRDVVIVEKIAGMPGQIVVTKDKLSCPECQHFRQIHTIRGCRAPNCTCTRKGDQ